MDYTRELKELLRPLGIYDVDNGAGAAELESIGTELTGVWSELEEAEQESCPLTAEGCGLENWEKLLPFIPAWRTQADRRRAIAALLRIDGSSFTCAALNDTIAGCGIRAEVYETETPMSVQVAFTYDRGVPDNIDDLRARIEQIIPCHLGIEYIYVYVTWAELEALFSAWAEIDAGGYLWKDIQRLGGEEE